MPYGYCGKILRVDLSTGAVSVDEHDDTWYRRHVGGAGVSGYYLLKELEPGIDPLGPSNKLIMAMGVITGIPVSGSARSSVGAKSPMTGGIGKSEAGGYFGAELKHAGYDGIIFEGRAPKPVYLWIKDGAVELRDASHLWGKGVLETEETIKAETGERFARIASIGPGGEKLTRFACIIHDLKGAAGRGGMGAVMGSKNLKAVAARGRILPPLADPDTVKAMGKAMARAVPTRARSRSEYGTGATALAYSLAGTMPTRNHLTGWFENVEAIDAIAIKNTIRIGMEGCYACAIRCKKVVKVEEPWVVDPRYGGPEYETCGSFGSNCGIDNLKAIARAHHLCQHYGLDTISAGNSIAFAMECFEKGYITGADTGGIELTFGNAEAMLRVLEMIGERQGIGDLLAEGTLRAARQIGGGAEDLAIHVKGLEVSIHDPRCKVGQALNFCVANQGADHTTGLNEMFYEKPGPYLFNDTSPLGILDPMPINEMSPRKANLVAQMHRWRHLSDCVAYCYHVPWSYDEVGRLINATTGWNTSLEELLLVGERAITLGRAFNVREGFTPADDRLPHRFFSPPPTGPLAEKKWAIDPTQMENAVRAFYYLMGWDPRTGVPTRITFERLGMGWAADELARHGILQPLDNRQQQVLI